MLNYSLSNIGDFFNFLKEGIFFKNQHTIAEIQDIADSYDIDQKALRVASKITPLEILDDNKTVYTKNNALVQVIRFEGKDYSGVSNDEQDALFSIRKRLFNVVSSRVTLTFHYFRRKVPAAQNSKYQITNKYADQVVQAWNKNFKDTYRTEMYLVIRIPVSSDFGKKIKDTPDLVTGNLNKVQIQINKKRDELDAEVIKLFKMLERYDPNSLVHTKDNKSDLIKFFDYLINSDLSISSKELSLTIASDLDSLLALTDIDFNKADRLVTMHHGNKKKYCRVLALNVYPLETDELIFDNLLRTKHHFNITQHVLPADRDMNKMSINKKIDQLRTMAGMGFMGGRFTDLEDAGEAVESGEDNFHNHVTLIHVYSNSIKELDKACSDIEGILNHSGITLIREGLSLELAYWSNLPDYERLSSARKGKISERNLSDFISLGNSLEGLSKCPFGDDPITTFKTTHNTNYSFTFHRTTDKEALGHTMIIGAPESGKTTLIAFLLMNCLKYPDLRILCFDSLNGLKVPVTAFGGEYIDAGSQEKMDLNPFLLPDNHRNKEFLKSFIEILIKGSRNKDEKHQINEIIKNSYELSPQDRSLGIVTAICGKPRGGTKEEENITARIEQWLPNIDGEDHYRYGGVFNSKKNSLSFDKRIVGIDMTDTLGNPELLSPLSSYIFHSFDEYVRNNPCPHICFIDELATYIQNDTFANFTNRAAQEWRKRKGVIIGAVQNIASLAESQHGKKIISNLATYIIFPNPSADPSHYMEELGLNDSEFNWVRTPNPERQVMVKRRGGESVILNIDLSSLGESLKLFSSGHEYVAKMDKIIAANSSNDNDRIVEQYLKAVAS